MMNDSRGNCGEEKSYFNTWQDDLTTSFAAKCRLSKLRHKVNSFYVSGQMIYFKQKYNQSPARQEVSLP